jgi:hypothetical protein
MAQTFEGVWKGTSLCQVKNSPCHDETVVYYISKDSVKKTFDISAYKIVSGKEDFMGTIVSVYDEKQNSYVSVDKDRDAKWEFKMTGNTIKGTLIIKGALFRLIDVKKDK